MQRISIGLLFIVLVTGHSCIHNKQLKYLQDVDEVAEFFPHKHKYTIREGDLLYVRILTLDMAFHEMFEPDTRYRERVMTNEPGLYIEGYAVNDKGNITLPVLENIHVAGNTVEEAKAVIQKEVDELFKDAKVELKLLNFRVTVLGEVARPGVYNNYLDHLTVFEAIGRAGNITEYGNRTNVLLMRQGKNSTTTIKLDLTASDIINSEAYFLQPNDIIIVEPNSSRAFNLNIPTISLAFSAVSTFLLLLNFFR